MAGTVEQPQRRVPSPAGFRGLLLLFARKLLLDPLVLQLATASLATWLMAIGRAALRSPWDPAIDGMVGAYDLVALASLLLRALGIRSWIPRGAAPRRPVQGAGPAEQAAKALSPSFEPLGPSASRATQGNAAGVEPARGVDSYRKE
jgi:hypothetical protein